MLQYFNANCIKILQNLLKLDFVLSHGYVHWSNLVLCSSYPHILQKDINVSEESGNVPLGGGSKSKKPPATKSAIMEQVCLSIMHCNYSNITGQDENLEVNYQMRDTVLYVLQ